MRTYEPSVLLSMLNRGHCYGREHPEVQDGEVFICYELRSKTDGMDLPGKRFGTVALDIEGIDLTKEAAAHEIVPVFANRAEHAERYTQPV